MVLFINELSWVLTLLFMALLTFEFFKVVLLMACLVELSDAALLVNALLILVLVFGVLVVDCCWRLRCKKGCCHCDLLRFWMRFNSHDQWLRRYLLSLWLLSMWL